MGVGGRAEKGRGARGGRGDRLGLERGWVRDG